MALVEIVAVVLISIFLLVMFARYVKNRIHAGEELTLKRPYQERKPVPRRVSDLNVGEEFIVVAITPNGPIAQHRDDHQAERCGKEGPCFLIRTPWHTLEVNQAYKKTSDNKLEPISLYATPQGKTEDTEATLV